MSKSGTQEAAAAHPGMGAFPIEGGFACRVWAPHAEAVHFIGDANGWEQHATPLTPEGNGHWYGEVPGAQPGQEYQFLIRAGADSIHRIDPRAIDVTSSVGNGILYDHSTFDWEDDELKLNTPALHELVIYEAHIGSFVATPDGRPASLEDVAAKLDYLVQLGVNAIELMPLMEFAGDVSWGYNPAHIFAVESAYGGADALKEFVKLAHRRGIAVILDVVYNHFGPSDLPTWQFDGWSENGKGGIYFYNDWRSSTPWGDTRPDYGRSEVRDFILDNVRMWLADFHLDGLRLDMTPYMRAVDGFTGDIPEGWAVMRSIGELVRADFPGRVVIAEDLHNLPAVTAVGNGGAAMHAQWDSQFVHPVRQALITPEDSQRQVAQVADAIVHRYHHPFDRVIYIESHDEVANGKARITSEARGDNPTGWHAQKRATLGATLVLTAPGIPMLFQGQEFLEDEWFRDTVPLDWEKAWAFRDITGLFRDLIRMRRNLDGDTAGLSGPHTTLLHVDEGANVLAYVRSTGDGQHVLVVANLSQTASRTRVELPTGSWRLLFNSDAKSYSQIFGGHPTGDLEVTGGEGVLEVGPWSAVIYVPA